MNFNNISTITWLSQSPDLNIVEDIWKTIPGMVNDGPEVLNAAELEKYIVNVKSIINSTRRHIILDLHALIRKRLCKVLTIKVNFYNSRCLDVNNTCIN